jgi:hypothetical protein
MTLAYYLFDFVREAADVDSELLCKSCKFLEKKLWIESIQQLNVPWRLDDKQLRPVDRQLDTFVALIVKPVSPSP